MLSTEGEAWLLPRVGRLDGFPFYDILTKQKPDAVDGDHSIYAAARNAEIDVPKIVHFAMGIFWKASVHSWSGTRTKPLIELGNHGEEVRKFLRGEADFPEKMALILGYRLLRSYRRLPCPIKGSATEFDNFLFHVPGINFALDVGEAVGEEMRSTCFASHRLHPIVLTNLADAN